MTDQLTKERIEQTRIDIAKVINTLESVSQRMDWVFDRNDEWDNGIQYQIEDATRLLGMSLATLTNWWDDEDVEDKQE